MTHIVEFDNYRKELEKAIAETRDAIEAAMILILQHEDGPLTMMEALQEISEKIDRLESDLSCSLIHFDDLVALVSRARRQRDQALKERNGLIASLRQRIRDEKRQIYW